MKRRDFLITSAGLTGSLLPVLAYGRPCPPSTLSVEGGTTANTTCTSGNMEADWRLRSGQDPGNPQPGVVWFHDFRSDAEVNAFRWSAGIGNDPNATGGEAPRLRRNTTDGLASGSCLEVLVGPGGSGQSSYWWRPFSPFVAPGNGKSANDPGAGGTIGARPWNSSDRNQLGNLGNDQASSVYVPRGFRVRLCENETRREGDGRCEEYTQGRHNLRFNDSASWIRVWRN
jgi:hypothetical protein